jgi:hypothetical protein
MQQVVTVNGRRHVDCCNNFGGHASAMIWCAFMSLVLWIANFVVMIEAVLAYMDDMFSHDDNTVLVLYRPYNMLLPSKQVQLLQLWDDISLPHDREKQEYRQTLVITGFVVDPDAMTISLSSDRLLELVSTVTEFVSGSSTRGEGCRHKLWDWLHLIGWMSWALTVCPLLRPALSSAY